MSLPSTHLHTVTPSLGSVNHFRVDETLLESLEGSVVIVGSGANEDDVDVSVSSDESDSEDEAPDGTPVGWDYIPADMNIPSLPINEGELRREILVQTHRRRHGKHVAGLDLFYIMINHYLPRGFLSRILT